MLSTRVSCDHSSGCVNVSTFAVLGIIWAKDEQLAHLKGPTSSSYLHVDGYYVGANGDKSQ